MSQPTREEIIDAYKTIEYLISGAYGLPPEEVKKIPSYVKIAKFLPPLPRPTMADVEWDYGKHYMAEAEHVHDYTVIMLKPMRSEPRIKCLAFYDGDFCIVYSDPEDLTPTGRYYTPTQPQENQ